MTTKRPLTYNQNGVNKCLIGNWQEERALTDTVPPAEDSFSTTKSRILPTSSNMTAKEIHSTQRQQFGPPENAGIEDGLFVVKRPPGTRRSMKEQKLWEEAKQRAQVVGREPYVIEPVKKKVPQIQPSEGAQPYHCDVPITVYTEAVEKRSSNMHVSRAGGANPFGRSTKFSAPIGECKDKFQHADF